MHVKIATVIVVLMLILFQGNISFASDNILKAGEAYKKGEYQKSLSLCSNLLETQGMNEKSNKYIKSIMILNYLKLKEHDKEIQTIRSFIEDYPTDTTIPNKYFLLALAYRSQNKIERAIDIYNLIIEKYPEEAPKAQYLLGSMYYYYGKNDKAGKELHKAINLYPQYNKISRAHYELIQLEIKNRKTKKAIKAINEFMCNYPESKYIGTLQHQLGQEYFRIKNYDKAIENLQKAIDNYPGHKYTPFSLYTAELTSLRRKDKAGAIKYYEQLKKDFPESKYVPEAEKLLKKRGLLKSINPE